MSTVIDKGDGIKTAIPETQTPVNAILMVDPQTKALLDWQDRIHHELKAMNSKLSWFVFLTIIALIFSFFGALLR